MFIEVTIFGNPRIINTDFIVSLAPHGDKSRIRMAGNKEFYDLGESYEEVKAVLAGVNLSTYKFVESVEK